MVRELRAVSTVCADYVRQAMCFQLASGLIIKIERSTLIIDAMANCNRANPAERGSYVVTICCPRVAAVPAGTEPINVSIILHH